MNKYGLNLEKNKIQNNKRADNSIECYESKTKTMGSESEEQNEDDILLPFFFSLSKLINGNECKSEIRDGQHRQHNDVIRRINSTGIGYKWKG